MMPGVLHGKPHLVFEPQGHCMAKYTLRAVFREADGKVTNIADSWRLTSVTIEGQRPRPTNRSGTRAASSRMPLKSPMSPDGH